MGDQLDQNAFLHPYFLVLMLFVVIPCLYLSLQGVLLIMTEGFEVLN